MREEEEEKTFRSLDFFISIGMDFDFWDGICMQDPRRFVSNARVDDFQCGFHASFCTDHDMRKRERKGPPEAFRQGRARERGVESHVPPLDPISLLFSNDMANRWLHLNSQVFVRLTGAELGLSMLRHNLFLFSFSQSGPCHASANSGGCASSTSSSA